MDLLEMMVKKKIRIQAYYQEFLAEGYPPYVAQGKAETKWDEEQKKFVQDGIDACPDGFIKRVTQKVFDMGKSIGLKKG